MASNKIRELRKAAGLTQEQLSARLDIKRATLARYEAGTIDPPTSQLQAIAAALGVSVDRLLGQDDDHTPAKYVMDDFSVRLLEATANLSEADRRMVLDMARRMRDAGEESAGVLTSKGPFYLYYFPDSTEASQDPPQSAPTKDTAPPPDDSKPPDSRGE